MKPLMLHYWQHNPRQKINKTTILKPTNCKELLIHILNDVFKENRSSYKLCKCHPTHFLFQIPLLETKLTKTSNDVTLLATQASIEAGTKCKDSHRDKPTNRKESFIHIHNDVFKLCRCHPTHFFFQIHLLETKFGRGDTQRLTDT